MLPVTFERLMEKGLHGLLSRICLVYMDDVIIFGKSFVEITENLKKCILFARKVRYLGHIVTSGGVTTNPEKISAVRDWPIPHTKK